MAAPSRHVRDPLPILSFILTLWTDDPVLAARADRAGIDRIGIDLERLGKAERQKGLGTWISPHAVEALPALRAALSSARLFARTNPVHDGSRNEVKTLLAAGVEVLMLPMFSSAAEVACFTELVGGRAEVVLLLERVAAVEAIDDILELGAVTEVHVGINDLALDLELSNRFLVLTHELTAEVADRVRAAGRRFGIGGVGRVTDDVLPIPSSLIYAQYARLGATAALVSRAFLQPDPAAVDIAAEVARAREQLASWSHRSEAELEAARDELATAAARSGRW